MQPSNEQRAQIAAVQARIVALETENEQLRVSLSSRIAQATNLDSQPSVASGANDARSGEGVRYAAVGCAIGEPGAEG